MVYLIHRPRRGEASRREFFIRDGTLPYGAAVSRLATITSTPLAGGLHSWYNLFSASTVQPSQGANFRLNADDLRNER